MCTHGHRHAYTYNQGLKDSSLSSKSHSSYGRGRIIHWKEEAMRWNQVPQAWLCVYFQEPEVSELKSVQSSNHGIYLASDTQEHAGSGRASSMPRLTVDPQVKKQPPPTICSGILGCIELVGYEKASDSFDLSSLLLYKQDLAHVPPR